MFSQPQIRSLFNQYVLVRLYVGDVPAGVVQSPDGRGAEALRDGAFHTESLPHYPVIRPRGEEFEVLDSYGKQDALIRDVDDFAAFLQKWLDSNKKN